MQPSVGRLVHYYSDDRQICWPAVITAVHSLNRVDLFVIGPRSTAFVEESLRCDPEAEVYSYERPGTWHWPEQVE